MNSKEFGLLIKAMRYEAFRCGVYLTQTALARRANATPKIISNLECGRKVHFEPELLMGLANAFNLSSSERVVFFQLANTLSEKTTVQEWQSSENLLQPLLQVLANVYQPAFLVDHFDNVVAVNSFVFGMFPFLRSLLQQENNFPGAYNAMRFVFSNKSGFAENVINNRQIYLEYSLRRFRVITLPYRATRYYQDMMEYFLFNPEMTLFAKTYEKISTLAEPRSQVIAANPISFRLPTQQQFISIYAATLMPVSTPYGNLYLTLHIPADVSTMEYFRTLLHTFPNRTYTFSPWPVQTEIVEFYPHEEMDEYMEDDDRVGACFLSRLLLC